MLDEGEKALFHHVVLIRLKDATPELRTEVQGKLLGMRGQIEPLKSIEVGVDVIHSERSYDIALLTAFESLSDMQAYQVHPLHQEVLTYLKLVSNSSISVDFEK